MAFKKEYRFSHRAAKMKIRSKSSAWLPVVVTAMFLSFFLVNYFNKNQMVETPVLAVISASIIVLALFIGWRIGMKKAIKALTNQTFSLSEDGIEHGISEVQKIFIPWNKIESLKQTDNALEITGSNNLLISIPNDLDGINEIDYVVRNKFIPESDQD